MTKTQIFKNMHLHPTAIKEVDKYLMSTMFHKTPHSTNFEVTMPGRVHWCLDTFDQFLAEYPQSVEAVYQRAVGAYEVSIVNSYNKREFFCEISVRARFRHTIDTIFDWIEAYREVSTVVPRSQPSREDQSKSTKTHTKTTNPKTRRRDRKRPCRNLH